jgi:prepilin-type N-terminal cleavage/methylation domain-containing protein
VAIRPPKYNSQGYTLLEMLAVISIVGIVIGFAAPSLLALNKPLRDGTSQFKSTLGLIRSKAISSNQAYRIRPKYFTTAEYLGQKYPGNPHNFIVEYAANCQVNTYGYGIGKTGTTDPNRPPNLTYPNGIPDGWQQASQFDLDLPESVGVVATPMTKVNGNDITDDTISFPLANQPTIVPPDISIDKHLNWNICYDNRGIAFQAVTLTLKDFQGNNRAKTSVIQITGIGQLDITTKDNAGVDIPKNNGNSVF